MMMDLNLDNDEFSYLSEIESVCFNCFKNGCTRLLVMNIPFFKEVIVSSFNCEHCGFQNRSLQPAACMADSGQKILLKVKNVNDLSRRVVISSGSSILLPEYDSIFPLTDGKLTTIEGALSSIIDNLKEMQPEREKVNAQLAEQIQKFIEKLQQLLSGESAFTFILDDPTGNGFIENVLAPDKDPQLEINTYDRTAEQNEALGLAVQINDDNLGCIQEEDETKKDDSHEGTVGRDEVLSFAVNCPSCDGEVNTRMKVVDIPYFKEVILMAINCSHCGYKDSEVQSGAGIEPRGRIYRLRITNIFDLSRDVLISTMATIRLPDLEFESLGGTMGGRFTTIEGILSAIKKQLVSTNPFVEGDSSVGFDGTRKLDALIKSFDEIIKGTRVNVTFELEDPSGTSYVQNVYAPDPDPELQVTDYDRSYEDNEALGLNDMKVTDYETPTKN